ncbi:hypothetical protein ACQ4M5_05995 [Leptolyngbya sp. AN10]
MSKIGLAPHVVCAYSIVDLSCSDVKGSITVKTWTLVLLLIAI